MLQGVRVVELATVLAAPSATAALADYGAEVIKVESPAGDMWRKEALRLTPDEPHGPLFENTNRGKKSVVMDLKDDAEVQLFHRLLATAEVPRPPVCRGLSRARARELPVPSRGPASIMSWSVDDAEPENGPQGLRNARMKMKWLVVSRR
ncbi:unnamed protein product [Prorocentrum cordatum]|uniref:Uncharacterized protein n=1 Tax=Prorocentrum cordatum TaxID=2364126 RepID=A0ABN9YA62_9DINO|nr:unnamed protein product [Polarella glacialis]